VTDLPWNGRSTPWCLGLHYCSCLAEARTGSCLPVRAGCFLSSKRAFVAAVLRKRRSRNASARRGWPWCRGAVAKCRPRGTGIGSSASNAGADPLPAQWVHRTSSASVAGLHRAPMGLALRVLSRAICNPAESPRHPEAEAIGEPDWDPFVVPWGESPQCRRSATLSARARQLTPKAPRESRVSRCLKLLFGPLPN
jgi:hypothetical protein